ncbi:DNA primase [Tundrisphaera lichenicola]|uniref:DNA primase n=1 Tax=Tundrisphaera lichenicola TaxID=2029860 RepID=UPI003EC05FE5
MPRHTEATLAAIKHAIDIVTLVGEYLPVQRSGSKFKALCPFHDDHNPSLELNPDRQSFKCWSCGAGGDIFDFVKDYERVDFPEALRMLADRAGVPLGEPEAPAAPGLSKVELLAVTSWAESTFVEALSDAEEARSYLQKRGISAESIAKFRLGYAPESRDWLTAKARRAGISAAALEKVGLIVRSEKNPVPHERFRGRLIFPIHDPRGRTLGFGGRIMPSIEQRNLASGMKAAKYLNSPETPLFQKRRILYGADLARPAARSEGWIAVVEGYTDVIAAHQVGLSNAVGTLGTALGDDHVTTLRRLADRSVLVFDGDEAGQKAADRSLELFLGHEVDVRVLTLPDGLDPCDFLLREGSDAFRSMVDDAVDPLAFAIDRASGRFDFGSAEGSRQAAEWVLSILARIPSRGGAGLDLKVAKALDTLSRKLSVPIGNLRKRLGELRRPNRSPAPAVELNGDEPPAAPPIRPSDLDPIDRELVQIVLNEPSVVARLITRVTVASLGDAPLRAILQACYDLHGEGSPPTFDRVTSRLDDPALRALAAGLLLPIEPAPLTRGTVQSPFEVRLARVLDRYDERDRQSRLRDLDAALAETDPDSDPVGYQALRREKYRLLSQRPDTKK